MSKANKISAKINPFKFQTKIHKRTENPTQYSKYNKYKPFLEREFNNQCVYCRKPYLISDDKSSFHVEHYRPKKHFPNLVCEYANLYFACAACNRNKGSYWDDTHRIVNPCEYVMSQHLKFHNHEVINSTKLGGITEDVLQLNSQNSLAYREYFETTITALVEILINPPKPLSKLEKQSYSVKVDKALDALSQVTGQTIDDLKKIIKIKI